MEGDDCYGICLMIFLQWWDTHEDDAEPSFALFGGFWRQTKYMIASAFYFLFARIKTITHHDILSVLVDHVPWLILVVL